MGLIAKHILKYNQKQQANRTVHENNQRNRKKHAHLEI